jgi:hypothetical protein
MRDNIPKVQQRRVTFKFDLPSDLARDVNVEVALDREERRKREWIADALRDAVERSKKNRGAATPAAA